MEKGLAGISSKMLCVSENDFEIAHQTIGIAEDKLEVIVNKIFPVQPSTDNMLSDKEPDITRILFLGRLAPPKLPIALVKAVANELSIQLDIVGDGPDMDMIKELIDKEDIRNVNVRGKIKSFDAFGDYDLFGLVSKSEGLPLSAVEALSCGLPILISNVGGCPEVIDENGYLADNSPEDILKGIHVIQGNLKRFSENSSKLFSAKFDLSANYRAYLDLYEEVLA